MEDTLSGFDAQHRAVGRIRNSVFKLIAPECFHVNDATTDDVMDPSCEATKTMQLGPLKV